MSTEREKFEAWAMQAAKKTCGIVLGKLKVEGFNQRVQSMFTREAAQAISESHRKEYFVTPDGSASTYPRDAEWAKAVEAVGVQVDSFGPIELSNVAALRLTGRWISVSDELPPLGEWDWDSVVPNEGVQQSKPMPLLLEDGTVTWGEFWRGTNDHGTTISDSGWTSQDGLYEYQRKIKTTHWMKISE